MIVLMLKTQQIQADPGRNPGIHPYPALPCPSVFPKQMNPSLPL
jgi:hypothetical protein